MPRFNVTSSYSVLFDAKDEDDARAQMNALLHGPIGRLYEKHQTVERIPLLSEKEVNHDRTK